MRVRPRNRRAFVLGLLIALAGLLGGQRAWAQTTTVVTANVKDVSGNIVPTGQVTFDLEPGIDTTISGNARFTPQTTVCTINQAQNGGTGAITSLARASNVVTATFSAQTTFIVGDVLSLSAWSDATFDGTSAFTVTAVSAVSPWTVTWNQTAANSTATGGTISALRASPGPGSCTLTENTALTPAGTYYKVTLWPNYAPTSSFNFYALTATQDLSSVVPTPATVPAFSFVDLFSNQTISGAKTFTGSVNFTGAVSGNVAAPPAASDGIQIVSGSAGNDSNSGRSAGAAKATIDGALASPDCATGNCQIWLTSATITVSSPIAITEPNIGIHGIGGQLGTLIDFTGTGNVFNVSAQNDSFSGFNIVLTSASTRAASVVFNVLAGATLGRVKNIVITGNVSDPNNGGIFLAETTTSGIWDVSHVFLEGGYVWNYFVSIGGLTSGTVGSWHMDSIVWGTNTTWVVGGFVFDSGVDTFIVTNSEIGADGANSAPVILCEDTQAYQAPRWLLFDSVTLESNGTGASNPIQLNASRDFQFDNGYISASFPVQIGPTSGTEIATGTKFIGNVFPESSANVGAFSIQAQSKNTLIQGNTFEDPGSGLNATYSTISAAAGASDFTVSENTFQHFNETNLALQDILIAAGASDRFRIIGNNFGISGTDFTAAVPISNGATGTHFQITGNTPATQDINAAQLTGTVTVTGTALAAGACDSNTVTITGAATSGKFSNVVVTQQTNTNFLFTIRGFVSAANTVEVEICAPVAGTATTQAFNVAVF